MRILVDDFNRLSVSTSFVCWTKGLRQDSKAKHPNKGGGDGGRKRTPFTAAINDQKKEKKNKRENKKERSRGGG